MDTLQLWAWYVAEFIRGYFANSVPAPILMGLPVLLLGMVALAKR